MKSLRLRPPKPLDKQVREFVCHHLADKGAFAPFTGTDYDAWHAYIHLVRLWGRVRRDSVVHAIKIVVHNAQYKHDDVMAVFKKSIPSLLDWSDEPTLWQQVAPGRGPSLSRSPTESEFMSSDTLQVCWPCEDGPRVCKHTNSKPYKHSTPEPGYTDEMECRDCKTIWRDRIVAPSK